MLKSYKEKRNIVWVRLQRFRLRQLRKKSTVATKTGSVKSPQCSKKGYTLGSVTPEIKAQLKDIQFLLNIQHKLPEKKRNGRIVSRFVLCSDTIYRIGIYGDGFSIRILASSVYHLADDPLAGVGCIYAFLLAGASLNMMAFIGIIMLAGIAVNNSILLVDAANRLKAEGFALTEAIKGAAQQRIRPIIMTSLTTILALLPMCFGFGEGASLRSPMALAVIGGLFTSTLMTLVVIPCVYYIFDKKVKNVEKI